MALGMVLVLGLVLGNAKLEWEWVPTGSWRHDLAGRVGRHDLAVISCRAAKQHKVNC